MLTKGHLAVSVLALGLFAPVASPALANIITSASATLTCSPSQGSLMVSGDDLTEGDDFSITYTFTLTPCGGGPADIISGTVPFMPASSGCPTPGCLNNLVIPLMGAPTGDWCVTGVLTAEDTTTSSPLVCDDTEMGTTNTCIVSPLNGVVSPGNGLPIPVTLDCAAASACPATIGFWKHHAFPPAVEASGLSIGGVTYTPSQLLTILNANGGNAVVILGRQLVGALLNLAAGGIDNPTADAAISNAETLLSSNSLNLLTSDVKPSSTLGQELLNDEGVLNNYNSANFNSCSEGSGLTTGPGK